MNVGTRRNIETVFLDRDGVINRKAADDAYVASVDDFHFLPGSLHAIRRMSAHGIRIIVVTNQQGVAKGRVGTRALTAIHARMVADVRRAGGRLVDVLVCPHLAGTCSCRKPATGLFHEARRRHRGLSFRSSVVVGDSACDMDAARAIGAEGILVADDGHGHGEPTRIVVRSLAEAADLILADG